MKALVALPALCVASLTATTTVADITVDQAFDKIMAMMQIDGNTNATYGRVDNNGSSLVVHQVDLSFQDPQITVNAKIDTITFDDLGDGTVRVEYADTMPIVIESNDPSVEFQATMRMVQSGAYYVLSGTPEDTTYEFSAPETTLTLDNLTSANADTTASATVTMTGGSGHYNATTDTMLNFDMSYSMENLTADVAFHDAESGEGVKFNAQMAGLKSSGMFAIPTDPSAIDQTNPFGSGMLFDMETSFANFEYAMNAMADDGAVDITFTADRGRLDTALDKDRLDYATSVSDVDMAVSIPQAFPLPIKITADELGMVWKMPLGKDVRGDYEIGTSLRNINVDENLLNMFDPGQIIPRDPITVAFDLSGQAMWYFDLFNPEEADKIDQGETPGEIYSAKLQGLEVRAAGAELTGQGDFTFDNTDRHTIPGMPRPQGQLALKLVGANALMDRLIQMGLISDD
ncbi:MAG: hypothetical protein ACPGRD_07565, partial [Planktomarina sp.]